MRIVIDMQGAQTGSRFRGIGRYTVSFSQAVARHRGEHEIILALNGLFPETIEPIRESFDGLLPQENIHVWCAPGPVRECQSGNDSRREVAECIRESFLASLSPDVIHICSLFEGYEDDAVISIGRLDGAELVSVTLHELMPLLNLNHNLKTNPLFADYYQRKLEYFKRAALYLSISDASRQEGLARLGLPAGRIIDMTEAMDADFWTIQGDDTNATKFFWDESARRAMAAWESFRSERQTNPAHRSIGRKPRLAYDSPLSPERTGVADYIAERLPAITEVEGQSSQAESLTQLAKILARQAEERATRTEAKAEQAEVKARQAEASAQQAGQRVALAEARTRKAEINAQLAEERAAHAEAILQAVYSSHSWRVTKPLRRLVSILRPKREEGNAPVLKSTGDQARTTPNWSGTSTDSVMPLDLDVPHGQESVTVRQGLRGINADQRTPLESSFHSYSDKLI